jgi:hypothetical protein
MERILLIIVYPVLHFIHHVQNAPKVIGYGMLATGSLGLYLIFGPSRSRYAAMWPTKATVIAGLWLIVFSYAILRFDNRHKDMK